MKLLVLGGTVFLGRHLVADALARGHEVTLFNRGQHNADLFPDVEKLRGDRDGNLGALRGRQWDVVVDTCGYFPRLVRDSAELLADAVAHYTFISTMSVYRDFSKPGITEDYPVAKLEDETTEDLAGENYGGLKALCEKAAEKAMPGRVLTVRSGLIVGPYDPSDRFTYWVWRAAQGGEMLAPVEPELALQVVDARDQAAWILDMAEGRQTGVYNVTGPTYTLTYGELFRTTKQISNCDTVLTWVPKDFIEENEIQPWSQFPLYIPADDRDAYWASMDCSKAIEKGLEFRPLIETVADTLDYARSRPADHSWRAGLSAEREKALLDIWHNRG